MVSVGCHSVVCWRRARNTTYVPDGHRVEEQGHRHAWAAHHRCLWPCGGCDSGGLKWGVVDRGIRGVHLLLLLLLAGAAAAFGSGSWPHTHTLPNNQPTSRPGASDSGPQHSACRCSPQASGVCQPIDRGGWDRDPAPASRAPTGSSSSRVCARARLPLAGSVAACCLCRLLDVGTSQLLASNGRWTTIPIHTHIPKAL